MLQHDLPKSLLDGPLPPDTKMEHMYDNWGFTIYRTSYGGNTDLYCESLLQTIKINVRLAITTHASRSREPGDREVGAAMLMVELFRLDDRSDIALEGKSLDGIRDKYPEQRFSWSKRRPGDTAGPPYPCVFLVADAEVLKDIGLGNYVFKCVDMDFFQRDYRHNWRVPQSYYGWMLMGPLGVLPLWQRLWNSQFLEEDIAPNCSLWTTAEDLGPL